MAAKKTTLEELGEMLAHLVKHITEIREEMATKDDLVSAKDELRAEMQDGFASIRTELSAIRRDLEELRARVDNMSGYSKEIDHLMERVRAIEKHLGIEPRMAA